MAVATIRAIGVIAVFALAFYVLTAVFYMKLFAKANVPAWKAWVPVVNLWKFLELGGYRGAFSLASIIGTGFIFASTVPSYLSQFSGNYNALPVEDFGSMFGGWESIGGLIFLLQTTGNIFSMIAVVFSCMSAYQISRKLGKDGAWVVLYIFLAIVWLGIMAFNKSLWNDSLARPAKGLERPPSWTPTSIGWPGAYPPGAGAYPPGAGAYPPGPGTYPPGAASQQFYPGQYYIQQPIQQSNEMAVAALILGLVGFIIPPACIAAVITGALGLKNPNGRGMAIAGLVLGILDTLIIIIVIVAVINFPLLY